jgi:hypothetical protein
LNYIYDLSNGWGRPTSKDVVFQSETVEAEALKQGYKLNATLYTNFFTVKVFEAPLDQSKYPWVMSVKSPINQFVIHTTSLPAFLECCDKLLIKDVSA